MVPARTLKLSVVVREGSFNNLVRLTNSNQLQLTISQMSLELVCVVDMTDSVLVRCLDWVEVPSGRDIEVLLVLLALHRERTQDTIQNWMVKIWKRSRDSGDVKLETAVLGPVYILFIKDGLARFLHLASCPRLVRPCH
jgi:hypothetical protein